MIREELPEREENIFTLLMQRYLPYWPLFVGLLATGLLAAWLYLNYYSTPQFEATATLIIKDENKGVDESKMLESMNIFNSKKIVENEIEVIQSKGLMKQVVYDLKLYAPVFEEVGLRSLSAYKSSPINVELKNPETIRSDSESLEKFYFKFDSVSHVVTLHNTGYPLNTWVQTKSGEMMFTLNDNYENKPNGPLYYILINPSIVVNEQVEKLNVSAANKLSTVVKLSIEDPVAERAEDVLNKLIFAYNRSASDERSRLAKNTLAFIEDRIKFVELDLNTLEKELQHYKSTKGVVDLSEQGKLYLQNVGDNERKIAEINLQLAVLDKIENYVVSKDNRTGIVPSTLGVSDVVLTQLLEKLYNAEIEYEKLTKTIPKNNPIVVSIANEIEKIRPSILENIRTHRNNLQASLSKVNSTKGVYNAVLQSIPQKERELLEISRRKAIKNDLFSFLLQKKEEAVLSYAPSEGDSRIVDLAESSPLPVSPKPLIIYSIATILALGAGTALSAGRELITNKVLYRSDIEKLTGIPVIGEVLHINSSKRKKYSEDAEKLILDQIKDIRLAYGLYGAAVQRKVVLITSSIEGEGKSFISENLAISMASSGRKVVLLNFDLQKPFASSIFSVDNKVGLAEYLTDGVELATVISATAYENLHVIPAGKTLETAVTALLDAELKNLFSYLRSKFDYVIVDTPPVGVATDAFIIAKCCDALLYVVRHNFTPKKALEHLERNAQLYEVKKLAIIFNDIKSRGFIGSGYGLAYGYGYKNINQYATSLRAN